MHGRFSKRTNDDDDHFHLTSSLNNIDWRCKFQVVKLLWLCVSNGLTVSRLNLGSIIRNHAVFSASLLKVRSKSFLFVVVF